MKINQNMQTINCWSGRKEWSNRLSDYIQHRVEWLVIHYTANDGDTAWGNTNYFAGAYRGSSAHLFVDEREVWQSVELHNTAWHCGDAESRNGCTNYNSIGIEMCSKRDASGNYFIPAETVKNTVALVKQLMKLYPGVKLCRHYDVTGKECPKPWVLNESLWTEFLKKVYMNEEDEPMTATEKKEFETLKKTVKELTEKLNAKGETPSKWAANAWLWAKSAGITDGTRPQGMITREQVVTMLWRVTQSDNGAHTWAQAAIDELDAFDIMHRDNPQQLVSREVLAVVISRLIAKTKNGEIKLEGN